MISLIIPIKNESPDIAQRFRHFADSEESELIVADGGGDPATSRALEAVGARLVRADEPRGARLARAAREAHGEILFFLHADSAPPENALNAIRQTLANGAAAGAFSLSYEGADARLRWIAWWANLRSRLFGLPFGDQGLFCRRDVYERTGGFRSLAICDDVDLVRRLKRSGKLVIRPEKTRTSPERYRERGALRQVLRNWRVLAGYFAGISPERLERWYKRK